MNEYGIRLSRREYRNEYLQSKDWRHKAEFVLARDPICKICDEAKSVDPHHLTYERIPFELETDLAGVCRKCHNRIHRHIMLSRISKLAILKHIFHASKTNRALLTVPRHLKIFSRLRKCPRMALTRKGTRAGKGNRVLTHY